LRILVFLKEKGEKRELKYQDIKEIIKPVFSLMGMAK
jgi:hypothetical protein